MKADCAFDPLFFYSAKEKNSPGRQNGREPGQKFPATGDVTHSMDEGGIIMPGGSSVRGGEELKSKVGNTPGGLSTGCIDNS